MVMDIIFKYELVKWYLSKYIQTLTLPPKIRPSKSFESYLPLVSSKKVDSSLFFNYLLTSSNQSGNTSL